MDSTLYEIFIPRNINGSTREFKNLTFYMDEKHQGDDISFHIDSHYFCCGNGNDTDKGSYYVCSLSSKKLNIPPDDYELQVTVILNGTELLRRDIIIHVVDHPPGI